MSIHVCGDSAVFEPLDERLGRFLGERVVVGEETPTESQAMLHGCEGYPFAALPPVDARVAAAHALAPARAVLEPDHRREGGDFGGIGDDDEDLLPVDDFFGGAAVETAVHRHDSQANSHSVPPPASATVRTP